MLDRAGVAAPRLQHGDGEATWILIEDAARRGLDTRVGLEDTIHDPDGSVTAGNEALDPRRAGFQLSALSQRSIVQTVRMPTDS